MNESDHGTWPGHELGHGLGYRLKTVREEQSLSQVELARRLGLSKSSIAKYEAGVHMPAVSVLVRLAQGLQVSTDYLVGLAAAAPPLLDDSESAQLLRELALLDETWRGYVVPVLGGFVKICRLAKEQREQGRA